MQLKAKIVIDVYNNTAVKNMIHSLALANNLNFVSISLIRYELAKFEADYDGSPYIFFYDEKKYLLWELKYSSACNVLDTAT